MNQQFNCTISSFNVSIELLIKGSSNYCNTFFNKSFWYEFIPGFSFSRINTNTKPPGWTIIESCFLQYDLSSNIIFAPRSLLTQVIVILESQFEYLRQQKCLYTMHGTVIHKYNKSVAFIGNISGIGKTSIATFATTKGWTWSVDEKFTLKNRKVMGGTTGILQDAKTRASSNGILPTKMKPLDLEMICIPIVTTENKLTKFLLDKSKKRWILYDELTRDIRQTTGIIDKVKTPLDSLDTQYLASKRARYVLHLIRTIPMYYLRGPESLIISEIDTILFND